jgi:hypothetical protein
VITIRHSHANGTSAGVGEVLTNLPHQTGGGEEPRLARRSPTPPTRRPRRKPTRTTRTRIDTDIAAIHAIHRDLLGAAVDMVTAYLPTAAR